MDNEKFESIGRKLLKDYYRTSLHKRVDDGDIYTVWLTKVLQNNKALLSTTLPDGRYFELTYNGDKEEFYLDSYVKERNVMYDLDSVESEAYAK
jgi:hypothetical protein